MADPFSIAAGGLGVFSAALELLGGCIKGFILLSTARNFGKDAPSIVCMLNVQEIYLIEWARAAGLLTDDGKLDANMNQLAVESILWQLKELLTETEKLKGRYGLALDRQPRAGLQTNGQPEEDGVSMGTLISDDTRRQILRRGGIEHEKPHFFQRLWWAAVDKAKMEKLMKDVQGFVNELRNLLDSARQAEILNLLRVLASQMVTQNNRREALESLAEVLKDLSLGDIASSAQLKGLRIDLEEKRPRRHQLLEQRLERLLHRQLTEFTPIKRNEMMGLARYAGQLVFVEKKTMERNLRSKIMPRVENLAALLSLPKDEAFRSLLCRGVVDDGDTVSLVFTHPHPDSPRPEPLTLLDHFSARSGLPVPSLTARVSLALQVARIVQSFHAASWLHKDLRSENILFFPTAGDDPAALSPMLRPFLAGFAFSRRDAPTEISEQPSMDPERDIYRHPRALGAPSAAYDAAMDAYSLGAVLLEVAEWRALRHLVRDAVDVGGAMDVSLNRLAGVRAWLLQGPAARLRVRMGDIYADACLLCLRGGDGGRAAAAGDADDSQGSWSGGEPSVVDEVVRLLSRCVV